MLYPKQGRNYLTNANESEGVLPCKEEAMSCHGRPSPQEGSKTHEEDDLCTAGQLRHTEETLWLLRKGMHVPEATNRKTVMDRRRRTNKTST